MKEEERFEEENILRESCQEPREPRETRGSPGSLHRMIRPFSKQSRGTLSCGGVVTTLLIRDWDYGG